MAAMDFPSSPTNGQVYGNYVYNTAKGAWQANPVTSEVAVISPTAPSNPKAGDIWYNSDDGCTYVYYYDGDSYQWVASRNDATFSSTLGPRVDALEAGAVNYIINGAFDIWQRGTSFSGNVYTADRWITGNNPSAVSRSTDVPSGFTYSLDITGSNHLINQRIESINSTPLYGKSITVSFYAKSSNGSNTMAVAIGTPSATDNFATQNIEYTSSAITITSSWARYSVTFNALSANISKGLFIYLYRNGATSTDRTLITGIQLQAGIASTTFRRNANSIQGELAACQRYYWQGGNNSQGHFRSATEARYVTKLPVTMRAVPTVTKLTNAIVGNPTVNDNQTGTGLTSPATNRTNSVDAVSVEVTGLSGGADARASSINNDCIIVSAEL